MIRNIFRRIKGWFVKEQPPKITHTDMPGYDPFAKPRTRTKTPYHIRCELRRRAKIKARNRKKNKVARRSRRVNRLRSA